MLGLFYTLVVIMGLMVLGLFIYWIINLVKEKGEPANEAWILTYGSQYSHGHALGRISNIEIGETKTKISFYGRDINYIKEANKDKKFKVSEETVFFDNKQIEPIAEGSLSMHSNMIFAYPNRIEDLPLSFRKTRHGQAIANIITENNKLTDNSELYQARIENLNKIALQTFGGGMMINYVEKQKELMKDSEIIKEIQVAPEKKP